MTSGNDEAATYFDYTKATVVELHRTLWGQVIQQDEFIATHARQKAEIAFLMEGGKELLAASSITLFRQKAKLAATERAMKVYDLSINIIAGAILQIGKQAISIRYGANRTDCPLEGRLISGWCVRDLIWLGRNQAMHYEETKPGSSWVKLFTSLNETYPDLFPLDVPSESRAMAILTVLGWVRYEQYESDMRELGV
ncbi:hypothetical protein [Pseudomonas fragi]|uniref:hypothetical protein n=1 Tax=Pseudomonas fragi TaxID=296 RepID=UPI001474D6D2|nr:hypothetical protein [Pseudomonas fragi]NNB17980.1 hypothetical protein [Pseudomonas fragi]NNB22808.1 hypothetical protein [Pseudomonas fragi]